MSNLELREEIAKALWAAFEYGLPVSPVTMANFVITQIEVAGYEIVKVGGKSG
jgi:hypothetical protein